MLKHFTAVFFAAVFVSTAAYADSKAEIDARVDRKLAEFRAEVDGAAEVLDRAAGVMVFPRVIKAGFVFGGEYGEGALRVDGRSVAYYSTASASWGFQIGGQARTLILAFMTEEALNKFRYSDGWEIGVDASVAVVTVGAGGSIDTTQTGRPILAYVYDQKGAMANLTLEGTKISRIHRD